MPRNVEPHLVLSGKAARAVVKKVAQIPDEIAMVVELGHSEDIDIYERIREREGCRESR